VIAVIGRTFETERKRRKRDRSSRSSSDQEYLVVVNEKVDREIAVFGKQNLEGKSDPLTRKARGFGITEKVWLGRGNQASPKNVRGGAKLKRNAGNAGFEFQQR